MDEFFKKISQNEQKVAALRDSVEEIMPMIKYVAKVNHEYYKSLKESGFKDEEAIKLVQAHGVNLKGQ